MITKMKKVVLFVSEPDTEVDADLTLLGQLGVMHITPYQPAKDASIDRVDARIKQIEKAINILDRFDEEDEAKSSTEDIDYSTIDRGEIHLLEKVLELESDNEKLAKAKRHQERQVRWYNNWGDVSIKDVELLKKENIWLKLFLLTDKDLRGLSDRDDIHVLGKVDNLNKVLLIAEDEDSTLDFDELPYPKSTLEEVKAALKETNAGLEDNKKKLHQLHAQKSLLIEALEERNRRFNVRNVQYGGLSIEEKIRCWKGFIPKNAIDKFIDTAKKRRWGYVIEDPSQEEVDEVPTLITSPRWAERIKPVMNFMGLVPGYKELDVSKVFMLFFTFFTGILVGDAGYGLVFLLLTLFVHSRTKFKRRVEFELIYTLSTSVMFWGVLTGTYFGSETLANIAFLKQLRVDQLASFGGDNIFVQKVMFLIGAVHLSIGHIQTAWKIINSVRAIAQLGWTAIVWGLYFVVNQMVLGVEAPSFMIWLFIGGGALVALFSKPGPNFLKGVLASLGNLPLSIINGFSDIISYIRLYAVGLATVLMAASFNQMAIGEGITTIISGIGAVIILILGHGLNMILAGMAVIVHGVRLNMLEYAGHASVEFSGNEYNPFKLKKDKENSENNSESEIETNNENKKS